MCAADILAESETVTRSLLDIHDLILNAALDIELTRKERIEKEINLVVELDAEAEWIRKDLRMQNEISP